MKYFEFNDPYYALISAETKEEALNIYITDVCDIEDGFEMNEISQEEAYKKIDAATKPDCTQVKLKKEKGLVLIDGCLM